MRMKSILSVKNFFLPVGGCLAAALILNNYTQSVPESLLYPLEDSHPELIQWMKIWGRLIFSSLATVLLIVLSMKVEMQKIIRWFFIGASGGIYLYFFHLIPYFMNNPTLEPLDQSLPSILLHNWIPASFFLLASYWPSTIILFIYSFANRYLNLIETCFTYPIFAIFGITIPILLIPSRQTSSPLITLDALQHIGLISVILTLVCFFLFEWISSKNAVVEERDGIHSKSSDRRNFFLQGGLVLVTAFLYQLNKSVWFSKGAVEYPAPQEYTHFLTSFEGLRSLGMLLDVIFLLFVLIALENRAGRAWKNIYCGIVAVSVMLGLFLITYNVFNNDLFAHVILKENTTLQSFFEDTAIGSGYQIFFTAVSYPVLLCLKEMTFQVYTPQKRFTAKLFVDLVFAKAGLLLATLASFIGGALPIMFRLFLFAAVLMLVGALWFYLAYLLGNKIEEMSPAEELA